MDEKLWKEIDELIRRAKEEKSNLKPSRRPIRGSLAEIIKTPEQAQRFKTMMALARLGIYV